MLDWCLVAKGRLDGTGGLDQGIIERHQPLFIRYGADINIAELAILNHDNSSMATSHEQFY